MSKDSNKKIPMEIVTLISDPVKRARMRQLIDYLKARDANKNKDIKVLEHLFYGLRFYISLISGVKGGYPDLNLEELIEAVDG